LTKSAEDLRAGDDVPISIPTELHPTELSCCGRFVFRPAEEFDIGVSANKDHAWVSGDFLP
jgi:hypothetical protein